MTLGVDQSRGYLENCPLTAYNCTELRHFTSYLASSHRNDTVWAFSILVEGLCDH